MTLSTGLGPRQETGLRLDGRGAQVFFTVTTHNALRRFHQPQMTRARDVKEVVA